MWLKYIYNKGTLYEMLEHVGGENYGDIDITTKNSDGTVDFVYMFYNGGTSFGEMVKDGLNRLEL